MEPLQVAGDVKLVEMLIPLADYAASYQVNLAIYPHYSLYCESIQHAEKNATMAALPKIGIVLNL